MSPPFGYGLDLDIAVRSLHQVPVHHDSKKAYFVALRTTWFQFDEEKLEEVKQGLRNEGMSEKEIEAKM